MSDLNHQDFATVQSDKQPQPVTIASAATIAPTTFLTVLTGTTTITTITPPVSGAHMLAFTSQVAANFGTGGNIAAIVTMAIDQLCLAVYNPVTSEYTIGVLSPT